jgi:hypothetical protein
MPIKDGGIVTMKKWRPTGFRACKYKELLVRLCDWCCMHPQALLGLTTLTEQLNKNGC